jgi:catechol 2,3-dioxygenase-like lactoylglutathione lyase family enzyme
MAPEPPDYFLPETGLVLSHLLIVRDVDRSREFYHGVLGAHVVRERNPCVLRFYNGYIVINGEGGPTDDKPDVQASAPPDSRTLSSAMNIRVTDIQTVFHEWLARGATFLTEPKEHPLETRCYLRDPDGYLIELGQGTGILQQLDQRASGTGN